MMGGCPQQNNNKKTECGGCPMDNNDNNPLNNMPPPNQQPSPGQPFPLPTKREISSIPKATGEGNWEYPSPQMFWNAMIKRGWRWSDEELTEKDMENIIKIHNNNNERAWFEILKWESLLHPECKEPKLKSFKGDSEKFSPRARFNMLIGKPAPFDRHDWIVDRCGIKDVRYIIDYYDNGSGKLKSRTLTHLDVRPAIQDSQSIWDRMVVAYHGFKHNYLGITPKFVNNTNSVNQNQ